MRHRLYARLHGLVILIFQVSADLGVLRVTNYVTPALSSDYCLVYNSKWTHLPQTSNNATSYVLKNIIYTGLCKNSDVPAGGIKDEAVAVMRGNCTFVEKGRIAQAAGAGAMLIASEDGLVPPSGNQTDYDNITIPVVMIKSRDILDVEKTLGKNVRVQLFSPPVSVFDYSILIIFLIAMFTVSVGGYWSGVPDEDAGGRSLSDSGNSEKKQSDKNVSFTVFTVLIFVAVCCVMLVLLYFFYKYLVYVVIAIFCLASALALYNCLSALVTKITVGRCRFTFRTKVIEVRLLFLATFCIALAVIWAVFRNEERWVWILQNILGIAFCINFIKTLKMPNFKLCVLLLILLLIYDVFFVFITPFFTKNGQSIMIEVAAGPSSDEKTGGDILEVPADTPAPQEKLPVVIRVPRLMNSAQTQCTVMFSLLGFGDMIVPGLLIAYCRRFDVRIDSRIYFISCTLAYAVGMVIAFTVLILTKMGQPALLYLVPFTIITSTVIAWRRGEIKMFWKGSSYEVLESSRKPLLQDDEPPGVISE